MARREVVELIGDVSGKPVGVDGRTVRFEYEGVEYEIDLVPRNAKRLDAALAPLVAAARRVGGTRRHRGTAGSGAPADKAQLAAIRAWARSNGYAVSDRGRISREIQQVYQRAR